MTYPGNSALAQDIQDRIRSTYQQTLELAAQGNRQEASLGCDFILRLDAEFAPARKLLERLESGQGPVAVDDLRPGAPGYTDGVGSASEVEPSETEEGATGLSREELRAELRSLLEEGEHEEVVLLAQAEHERVMAAPELREIARTAQNRQEAEPYIQSFLGKAREALRHDEVEQAKQYLGHARELDPSHPAIRDFAAVLEARGSTGPAPASVEPSRAEELAEMPDLSVDSFDPSEETAAEDSLTGGFSLDQAGGEGEESDARIRELLAEGQAAFERGELQEAIDAWSRIFLIDIDHEGAAKRIEKARALKDERERQVEETFHDAVSKLEAGNTEQARALFRKVLDLQPGHLAAREYLQELEEGRLGGKAAPRKTTPPGEEELEASAPADAAEPLSHEILVPPEPGAGEASPPAGKAATSASPSRMPSTTFLLVGGAVLLLVVAGAWLFLQYGDVFFPNAMEEAAVSPGATMDPIAQATRLYDAGRINEALERLRRIPPESEQHDEAQALVSQWEAASEAAEEPGEERRDEGITSSPGAEASERETLIAEARAHLEAEENLLALADLEEAASISSLTEEEEELREAALGALEPLATELELVRGADWEFALRELWQLHQADPQNQDVIRLLTTSYYNLGVRDLQRGDTQEALDHFQEALRFRPRDPELQRHLRFAQTYEQRPKDLLYEIYARKLSFRGP